MPILKMTDLPLKGKRVLIRGIGFTMSLFIGTLAFEYHHPLHVVAVRQGVLLGSCLSGMVGGLLLWTVCRTGKPRKRGIQ